MCHAWNFGWLGCLFALVSFRLATDLHTRAAAAKINGFGIGVAFYVTACGHPALLCSASSSFCVEANRALSRDVLVVVTFFVVRLWLLREKIRTDKSCEQSRAAGSGNIIGQADANREDDCSDSDGLHVETEELAKVGPSTSSLPGTEDENVPHQPEEANMRAFRICRQYSCVMAGLFLSRVIELSLKGTNVVESVVELVFGQAAVDEWISIDSAS